MTPLRVKMSAIREYDNSGYRGSLFCNYVTSIINDADKNDDVEKFEIYLNMVPNSNQIMRTGEKGNFAFSNILGSFVDWY